MNKKEHSAVYQFSKKIKSATTNKNKDSFEKKISPRKTIFITAGTEFFLNLDLVKEYLRNSHIPQSDFGLIVGELNISGNLYKFTALELQMILAVDESIHKNDESIFEPETQLNLLAKMLNNRNPYFYSDVS